ncbi:uncharacterized protein A4U43_C07F20240 [Asparagus officinalis]|uniref:Uncharacterized protein n=1 Tax=Asparagus officinalis TaxID=4686 RepID=A0A5P1EDE6_ASPOF|nr:uncharacterized protein LOC109850234 [Asparagus officinalis]ONK63916.1 uncharacterized protein A4U43_C07F20240 [Asparagus officinalis]
MSLVLIIPCLKKEMVLVHWNGSILEDEDEKENGELDSKVSKLKKKHPFILDVRHPFRNNLSIPHYIKFLNVNRNLRWFDTDFVENRNSNHLDFLCRTSSLVNIPINLSPSEMIIDRFGDSRRRRSASDLTDLFELAKRTFMRRSLLKSSIIFQLGKLDGSIRPFRATSFSMNPMKTFEFISSPLSKDPISKVTSPSTEISNSKASEKLLVCRSSKNSTISHQSKPSPNLTVSKGFLHCVWKKDSLNILFKEDNDSGKEYVASFHQIESNDQALDFLYIFHSRSSNKSEEFVGKMKVFSSLILNPNGSKSVETEFVLYGVQDHSSEMQDSTFSAMKNKGLSKVSKILKSSNSLKHKSTSKIVKPSSQLENGFQPNLELAATIVKSSSHFHEKDKETGGWGLKFLKKVAIDPLLNYGNSIDVLIPDGFHGGPITGDSRPSSLIERWRSSGHCDCEGWDIGCPLTVLHDRSSTEAFHKEDSQETKTVNLFIEGTKYSEPHLKMLTTRQDTRTIYFQQTLSSLQAFSVGVAIIHSQTPSLHPNL